MSDELKNRTAMCLTYADLVSGIVSTYARDAVRTEPSYALPAERLQDLRLVRLLHVAMGLVTEAGEFLDQLKKHIFYGKYLDKVNLREELGDSNWYERIGAEALETSLLEIMESNVAKLKARFPEKFSEEKAVNRDLDVERKILEGK